MRAISRCVAERSTRLAAGLAGPFYGWKAIGRSPNNCGESKLDRVG